MKYRILIALSVFTSIAFSQNKMADSLVSLEKSGKFYEIIDLVKLQDSLPLEQLFIVGNAYKKTFRYKKAEKYFYECTIKDSSNLIYLSAVADIYTKNGKIREAERTYMKILRIDSLNFNAKIQLANIYKLKKEYQEAFNLYSQLHEIDFYNPYYWEKMGYCKYLQDSLYESMYYYANAFLCDSTDLSIIENLCNLFRRTKNYQKGLMSSNDGLKVDSLNTDMLRYRALFSQRLEYFDSAINDYKKVISLNDTTWDVFMDLGICYFKTGRFEDASKNLQKFHEMKDDEPTPLVYDGMALSNIAQWEVSIEKLTKAEELLIQKDVAMVYYFMAKNLSYLGNLDSAILYLNKSLERNPDLSMSYYDLANIYDKALKKPKKAMEYFQKFIAIDRGNAMLVQFATQRIEQLKEELFFKNEY